MKRARTIDDTNKYSKQWYQHQHIAHWVKQLNRLPDAAKVKKDKLRSGSLVRTSGQPVMGGKEESMQNLSEGKIYC